MEGRCLLQEASKARKWKDARVEKPKEIGLLALDFDGTVKRPGDDVSPRGSTANPLPKHVPPSSRCPLAVRAWFDPKPGFEGRTRNT